MAPPAWRRSGDASTWRARLLCVAAVGAQLLPTGTGYLMCRGTSAQDGCGSEQMQQYAKSPAALAAEIKSSGKPWTDGYPALSGKLSGVFAKYPLSLGGQPISVQSIAAFAATVLESDPFQTGGQQIPWLDMGHGGGRTVLAIDQRQLAFIIANALMGNSLTMKDGLSQLFQRCDGQHVTFAVSLVAILAVLSQEIADGSSGATLIAVAPGSEYDSLNSWKAKLSSGVLQPPTVCAQGAGGEDCGLPDFMASGTPDQALIDIAGGAVGGGGGLCDLALTQDESLVHFYGETLALTLFSSGTGRLKVPWTLLGSRRYISSIGGNYLAGHMCGTFNYASLLNEDIVRETAQVNLNGNSVSVFRSSFVAIESYCPNCGKCPTAKGANNECGDTRTAMVEKDISIFYRSLEATMYNPVAQEAVAAIVRRVGTGPWGAGVWQGDSNQYFLVKWLATSLLGNFDVKLDYYIYSRFCENPANQCLTLSKAQCSACIGGPSFMQVTQARCPQNGVNEVIDMYQYAASAELLNRMLSNTVKDGSRQVFDILTGMAAPQKSASAPSSAASQQEAYSTSSAASGYAASGYATQPPSIAASGDAAQPQQVTYASNRAASQSAPLRRETVVRATPTANTTIEGRRPAALGLLGGERWALLDDNGEEATPALRGGGGGKDRVVVEGLVVKGISGLCLDFSGNASPGTDDTVRLRGCSEERGKYQEWSFDADAGRLSRGGLCLHALSPSKIGSRVVLRDCSENEGKQEWQVNPSEGTMRTKHGLCLDGSDGGGFEDEQGEDFDAEVRLWPCFASLSDQQWAGDDEAGLLRSRGGICLEAPKPQFTHTEVTLQKCNPDSSVQHWHLDFTSHLLITEFGSCLKWRRPSSSEDAEVDGNGEKLEIVECDKQDPDQHWIYDDESGALKNTGADKCLDSSHPKKVGSELRLKVCLNDLPEQQWV